LEETGGLKSPKSKAAPPKPAPFRVPPPPTTKEDGGVGMEGSEKQTEKDEVSKTNGTAASEGEEGTPAKADSMPDGVSKEVTDEATEQGSTGTENAGQSVPNVLYKVVASHPYEGEDEDELSFDKGTIVLVIPYDDPEDEVSVRYLDRGLGHF